MSNIPADRARPRTAIGLAAILAASCAQVSAPAQVREAAAARGAASETIVGEEFAPLHERFGRIVERLGAPGVSVCVVQDGEVVYLDAFGTRDDRGRPVTPETGFYIASATKPFVAMAVVKLAGQGKIDLDAPVRRYLPRFELADADAAERITVRDILCHRPGIDHGGIVFLDAYTGEITEDRYYRLLEQVTPSGRVSYSNVHFTIAGRIIEAVSGRKWQDYLRDEILLPIGMQRTTARASELYGDDDCALPMDYADGGFAPSRVRKTDRTMHAAGGMGTCAKDAARWLLLNLGEGEIDGRRIVPPELALEMQKFQSKLEQPRRTLPHTQDEGFGLGWMIGTYRETKRVAHGGGYVGSRSMFVMLPEYGLGIAVFANASGPPGMICELICTEIQDRILGEETPDLVSDLERSVKSWRARRAAAPQVEAIGAGDLSGPLAAYVGTYSNELWGTLRIAEHDGRIAAMLGDLAITLRPRAGRDRFTAVDATGSASDGEFELDEAGRVLAVRTEMGGAAARFARR